MTALPHFPCAPATPLNWAIHEARETVNHAPEQTMVKSTLARQLLDIFMRATYTIENEAGWSDSAFLAEVRAIHAQAARLLQEEASPLIAEP